jgi:hypothetical protein
MASLSEVYRAGSRGTDRQRLYAGLALFAAGAILAVGGIVVATAAGTTGAFGMSVFGARELAGVLAGIGLPATFLGAVIVLPRASARLRGAAGLGSAVALLAVVYFVDVYPQAWFANAGVVLTVYFFGTLTAFWCLFVAVANYKARNDPGGTVNLQVRKEGSTRVIEVPASIASGLGGVGLLGGTPDGDTATQTNRPGGTTTDGGSATAEIVSPGAGTAAATATPQHEDAEVTRASSREEDAEVTTGGVGRVDTTPSRHAPAADRTDGTEFVGESEVVGDPYCGNCAHFNYVRTEEGLQPYCSYHDEGLDDMEACRHWDPNTD